MHLTESHLETLLSIAKEAQDAIMEIYDSQTAIVEYKADNSPLTQADVAAHRIISRRLSEAFSDIPIVSEEGEADESHQAVRNETYWLVDPIDGTYDFINRTGDFCIGIGLMVNGQPAFGIAAVPAKNTLYYGGASYGAFKITDDQPPQPIHIKTHTPPIVVVSRAHKSGPTDAFIKNHFPDAVLKPLGSAILKAIAVAEGEASVYAAIDQPIHRWDLASGQAIVEGAGGSVTRPDNTAIDWQENSSLKIGDFIVVNTSAAKLRNVD